MTKPNYTSIAVVLDRSGSMNSVRDATISGFNEFLTTQKNGVGTADLSLYTFSSEVDKRFGPVSIADVKPLTREDYVPSGWTALYDAVGTAVNDLGTRFSNMPEHERPSKVIVVVQTDGEENVSRKFTQSQVAEMVKHQTDKYAWEFIFVGANQDAVLTGKSLGIASANSGTYTMNNSAQIYNVVSGAVSRSRAGGSSAFTDQELKSMVNPNTPSFDVQVGPVATQHNHTGDQCPLCTVNKSVVTNS